MPSKYCTIINSPNVNNPPHYQDSNGFSLLHFRLHKIAIHHVMSMVINVHMRSRIDVFICILPCCSQPFPESFPKPMSKSFPKLFPKSFPEQFLNHSLNHFLNQCPKHFPNHSLNHSLNQSPSQSLNHSPNHSLNHSNCYFCLCGEVRECFYK